MPELPEVETIRRQLAPRLRGRRIVSATAHPSPKFATATAAVGATIGEVDRRGKYLLAALSERGRVDRELIVHLGMTGSLRVLVDPGGDTDGDPEDRAAENSHVRARWLLDDGTSLVFGDIRRFGRIAVVPAGDHQSLPTLHQLGPEPFDPDFTPDHLWEAVRRSDRRLKTLLLGQRVVAGVGNIYADEALWAAQVHPATRRLSRNSAVAVHASLLDALAAGLENGGTTLRDYVDADGRQGTNQHRLSCYGRAGEPCLRCGTTLRRSVVDGRSTTWCPACQRR